MGFIRRGGKASKAAKQTVRYWGIQPADPVITSVVRVGVSYLSGDYDVYFNPGSGVGSAASSYTITASNATYGDRTFTATTSPYRVTGLRSGASWTFTIKANATIGQSNTNVSSGTTSGGSTNVTGLPGKPSAPSASSPSNVSYDTVSWSAPENGGSAITEYNWESNDGKSGTTSSTSVNVNQEGGTSQAYRVRAANVDGYGEWSDYSSTTTTFSFVPFSVFGFSPFGVFGFSPFGVFGFSPFGFSPFGVFGFSPFGFSPFGFTSCVHEDTLVSVVGEGNTYQLKAAKDVQPGDEIWAADFAEMTDENFVAPNEWTSATLTNVNVIHTTLVSKTPVTKTTYMTVNGDQTKKFSLNQPLLTKRSGTYFFLTSGSLEVGDTLVSYDYNSNSIVEIPVTSVDVIEDEVTVYRFDCEDLDSFIAGDLICHNLRKY